MLNPDQLAAVCHISGPSIVVAGPGAGKTETIASRFAYLVRQGELPRKITCLTFSTDAATQMKKRIARIAGLTEVSLKDSVSTFHSLGLRIVLAERASLGWDLAENPILQAGQDKAILRDLIRRDMMSKAKAYIGKMRRMLVWPNEAFGIATSPEETELAGVYLEYSNALRQEGVLDFDSMVFYAVDILNRDSVARAKWQAVSNHVIVDEAHDTSADQLALAKILAGGTGNLMVILDLSQAIYTWRGAEPKLILRESDSATKFFLPTNHRSGQKIIDWFKIFSETDELSAQLSGLMRSALVNGGDGYVIEHLNEYDQAYKIADDIQANAPKNLAITEDSFSGFAILARTKASLLPLCEVFEERNIPYVWKGKSFWQAREIQNLMAFCEFAIDAKNYRAFLAAATSGLRCVRYISRRLATAIVAGSRRANQSPLKLIQPEGDWSENALNAWQSARNFFYDLCRISGMRPAEFLRYLQKENMAWVSESQTEQPDDFQGENIEALIRRAEKFDSVGEFVAHAAKMDRVSKNTRGVTLSTIHSAKGLEWNSVYIVDVNQEILPHARCFDYDEERRLMYVAMSRAKSRLFINWHGKKSVFVNMIPQEIAVPVPVAETVQ